MTRRTNLFISYSHKDAELAKEVVRICGTLGVRCFLDRKDINWGESIRKAVGRGIEEATHVLVVVSVASLESGWVPFEVGLATGHGKRVLPLLVPPAFDLPGYLGDPLYRSSEDDLEGSLRQALLQSPTPAMPRDNTDWIIVLHKELLEVAAKVENRDISSHDVFVAVFEKLISGVPTEQLGTEVAARLELPGHYYGAEAPPEPFPRLLAPLVTSDLVRVQKRVSGVRTVLFATDRGKQYGHAFS